MEVPVETPAKITPRDTTPPKIYWLKDDGSRQELGNSHEAGQNVVIPLYRGDAVNTRLITIDDSGKVTDFKLENLQSGFRFTPVNGTATEKSPLGQNVTGEVGLEVKKGKYTARAISTDGTNSTTGYFVFDIHEQAEKNNPTPQDQTVNVGETPDPKKSIGNVGDLPKGTTVEYKTPVDTKTPGDKETTAVVTYPDGSKDEVPVTVKVVDPRKDAEKNNPKLDVEQDPKTGDVTVTPKQPDGSTYPPGTKVEIPGKDKDHPITVTTDENGKGKVPNADLPEGKVPGTGKITEPGKPAVEVPVETPAKVTPETPAQKTPTVELEQDPKTGDVTVTPKQPDGSTYPPGTKVEIPGKDGNPITVEIGENGKGKVPNSELPDGKVPGTAKITEPGQPTVEVPVTTPGKVTPATPAQKTPTVELEQDPKTGDVTVTPKKPDGTPYKPGTKVEIPGKDGNPITVTIGEDGKGKVPNSELPDGKVPGTAKITEPGKPAVEVPVTTPGKVTPATPTLDVEQDPKTGDVTVTPKKPAGTPYKPGTKVEIPGNDGNPITVTIGEDGKGKVPNSELPDGKVPGTAKITEPGQPTVEVPVTTPGKVTPATPTDTNPVAPVTPDTPVKSDTNGGSGQDASAPTPATPTPNAVTPNADQVDTKTTMDNGAKSNNSQNVLPNTGTESNATLASLGLLGLLSGFGLVARKKKED